LAGNVFGRLFRVITFGESHGPAIGCVIDGCPSALVLSVEDIDKELEKRRPGGGGAATERREEDKCEILSGVFEGRTLGTPIAIIIRNNNQHSADYTALENVYRPGHADFAYDAKYGFRDYRGGGRSSGRETAVRVAAGAVAKKLLLRSGIKINAFIESMYGIEDKDKALKKVEELKAEGDSAGGIVSCTISGLEAGLGEPVFDKLDALLAQGMLSLGAVKGFEIGSGFSAAKTTGSLNNDKMFFDGEKIRFKTNNAGGVLGGISTGEDIVFRVAFKPVPSISKEQETVNKDRVEQKISISGRHDACICPRAVPVVEAMAALVIADMLLCNKAIK